jgi:molybdopterin converting factor subunit 1
MNVSVKLFALARQRVGRDCVDIQVADDATVRDVRHALVEQHPPLADVVVHARLAVNNDYASDSTRLASGVEVALIPPVSGG